MAIYLWLYSYGFKALSKHGPPLCADVCVCSMYSAMCERCARVRCVGAGLADVAATLQVCGP